MSRFFRGPFSWASISGAVSTLALLAFFCFPVIARSRSTQQPAEPSSADVVERVSTSIVHIEATFSYQVVGDNNRYFLQSSGTGFIADSEGRVATANHVVDPDVVQHQLEQELAKKNQSLLLNSFHSERVIISIYADNGEDNRGHILNDNWAGTHGTILAQDKTFDIAILSCATNLLNVQPTMVMGDQSVIKPRTLPSFQRETARNGEEIAATGFPAFGYAKNPTQIPGLTTNDGIVANHAFETVDHSFVYLASIHINEGDSGGPVYDKTNGRIIGFVDAFLNALEGGNSGLTVVVPIRHVLDLLPREQRHVAAAGQR